jgi:hypothetical protein
MIISCDITWQILYDNILWYYLTNSINKVVIALQQSDINNG